VDQVAGQVEVEPAVPERPRLEAGGVGHGDQQGAARREVPAGMVDRPPGAGEVLERVPEDDGRPLPVQLGHVGVGHVGAGRAAFQAEGLAPACGQGIEEGPVPGSDVEHAARRRQLVDAPGEAGAGAAQHGVADPREAPGLRPVARVGRLELVS
jgi:hypothetical protein